MQVTETKNEALKREYAVILDAKSIDTEMESQLRSMGGRVKIPGFRPGHVPLSVLKQRFAKDVLGEVIERSVQQTTQRVLRDKNLRAAVSPKLEITSYNEGSDLHFRMEVELLPDVPEVDFSKLKLEKMVCDVEPKDIQEAIERLADRNRSFAAAEKGATAALGDQVIIDFTGSVGGKEFDGGKAKQFALTLGSGQFINGFEEQLVGAKAGDTPTVKVTFPEQYHKQELAGQPAEFAIVVHEVRKGEKAAVDADFAKKLGFSDVAAMEKAVEEQFAGDYEQESRAHLKKQLFDTLEEECDFPIPQGMYDAEFNGIWEKLQQARKEGDESLNEKSEEELREEYSKIARRRVKLGILLSEIAQKNKITVNQDELSRAVMQQASRFPGQERRVYEFYQKHPHHLEELRGPILEEKSVDFILGKAKIAERKVTREELMSDPDAAPAAEAPKKKAKKKKD